MPSVNKVILVGRLGADPLLKATQSGESVVTLSLCTNSNRKDKNGNSQELSEWHMITLWKKTADYVAQYCVKGDLLYIEGSLRTEKYTDRNGVNREKTKIDGFIASKLNHSESAPPPQQAAANTYREASQPAKPARYQPPLSQQTQPVQLEQFDFDEDIPF